MAQLLGTVKWFDEKKGYGFIAPDDKSKDVFVHHTDIKANGFRTLSEGQKVTFERVEDKKGPKATKVQVVS